MITLSSYAKALWPGVNQWFGMSYNEFPEEWQEIFEVYNSDMNFEEDVNSYGFGLGVIKPEGQSISYDDAKQGFLKRYIHVTYGLGFKVSREAVEDNKYAQLATNRAKRLAFSMKQTKENVCANVLNRAFNSSYTGADAVELCSVSHKLAKGGTYQNKLTTDADLSEAALEQACIDIASLVDDSGLKIQVMAQKLIIPKELMFEAKRILDNPERPATADRDINALNKMGAIPQGYVVNHYLTDSDAWFIKTNCPDGMKMFQRRALEFQNDTADFDTESLAFKATERYSVGWTDPRAIYGSQGAN